jgi:hypothetical protein
MIRQSWREWIRFVLNSNTSSSISLLLPYACYLTKAQHL